MEKPYEEENVNCLGFCTVIDNSKSLSLFFKKTLLPSTILSN